MTDEKDIFISYAKENRDQARELYERLRAEGLSPWFDEATLMPGQDWRSEVRRAIRESRLFLICLSRHAVAKKGFIQHELQEALENAREYPNNVAYVIPVLLEPCDVPDDLQHLQWADLSDSEGFDNLLAAIRSVLGESDTSELGSRAKVLFGGHLVKVRVTDPKGNPVTGALVELNEVEHKDSLIITDITGMRLRARTDGNGIIYFGLPNESEHISLSAIYVVSATAPGFDFAHAVLQYGQKKVLAMILRYPASAIVFSDHEVGERQPDEVVELKLERSTGSTDANGA